MMDHVGLYPLVHGTVTVGSLVGFLIRNEHRLTKLETKLEDHEKYHGYKPGPTQDPKRQVI